MNKRSMNINTLTIDAARSLVESRELSAQALAEAHYAQIASQDQTIGSFLTLTKERAQAQAERIDRLAEKGDPLPPLAGVPVAIKDVLMTRGERTTAGSRFLDKFIAPYDATAVERLEAAGAVCLGKLNCDEFAMGSSNENSAFLSGAQSARHHARSRRLLRWLRRGRCCRLRGRNPGLGYRWLDPPTRGVLWRGRTVAHLRPRLALRIDRLCQLARSRRAADAHGQRFGNLAGGHRRTRSRTIRLRRTCPWANTHRSADAK